MEKVIAEISSKSDDQKRNLSIQNNEGNVNNRTAVNYTLKTTIIHQSELPVNPKEIENLLEKIVKSEDNKYLLEKTLPAKEVEPVLLKLKHKVDKLRLEGIVRATDQGWIILELIKNDDLLKEFLDMLVRALGQDIVQDLFLQKDGEGNNSLHYLGAWGKFDVLNHLVVVTCKVFDENFIEKLLASKNNVETQDENNCHLLYNLITNSKQHFLDVLQINGLHESLIEKAFLLPGQNNERVLDKMFEDVEVFKQTVSVIIESHGIYMSAIMYAEDHNKETILFKMVQKNKKTMIEILNWFIEIINVEFIKNWFQVPNAVEENFLHQICYDNENDHVLRWAAEKLGKESFLNLIDDPNQNFTLFHSVCRVNNHDLFFEKFRLFEEQIGLKNLKVVLLKTNIDGDTFLNILIKTEKEIKLLSILELLLEKFDKDFFKKLFNSTNKNKDTFLHFIIEENCWFTDYHIWQLRYFISKYFNESADKAFVEDLVMRRNRNNWTVFDLAAICDIDGNYFILNSISKISSCSKRTKSRKDVEFGNFIENRNNLGSKNRSLNYFHTRFSVKLSIDNDEISRHRELYKNERFSFSIDTSKSVPVKVKAIKIDKFFLRSLMHKNDQSLWDLMFKNYSKEFCRILDQIIFEFGKPKTVMILKQKHVIKGTILHYSAHFYGEIKIQELLKILINRFGSDDVLSIITQETYEDTKILHNVCLSEIEDYLNYLAEQFDVEVLKEILLKHADIVAQFCERENQEGNLELYEFLKIFKSKFGEEFLKLLLLGERYGFTFLNDLRGVHEVIKVLNILIEEFGKEFVEKLVLIKNYYGSIFLNCLNFKCDDTDVKQLLLFFKSAFGKVFLMQMLGGDFYFLDDLYDRFDKNEEYMELLTWMSNEFDFSVQEYLDAINSKRNLSLENGLLDNKSLAMFAYV